MIFTPALLAIAIALALALFLVVNHEYKGNLVPVIRQRFSNRVKINFQGKKIVLNKGVHIPTRDSLFMYKNLKDKCLRGDVLEIGTGCGALPVLLNKEGIKWVCTEIHEKALENAQLNFRLHNMPTETVLSDVFDNVKGKYDFIIWNFPFIHGSETIMRKFVHGLPKHLKQGGRAYLLSSHLMSRKYREFDRDCDDLGISVKIIAKGRYHVVPIRLYELTNKQEPVGGGGKT